VVEAFEEMRHRMDARRDGRKLAGVLAAVRFRDQASNSETVQIVHKE
jgi:hypothetical protein